MVGKNAMIILDALLQLGGADDTEIDGTDEVGSPAICTDEMICSCQNIRGMHELDYSFLMRACAQFDHGEYDSQKEALDRTESEWWLKSITVEFNNFICRGGWQFIPLKHATGSGRN